MTRYEKWLGAGLGWVVGGPLGGLMGYLVGNLLEQGTRSDTPLPINGVSEFELHLIVLASYLIKTDGAVSLAEVRFINDFMNRHFDEKYAAKRAEIINHCLQKEYDLNTVCQAIRMNTPPATRIQIIHLLFDLAASDSELNERENYFIFRISGYLNVNDVEFRKIKQAHEAQLLSVYDVLQVHRSASMSEIRTAYRKLVLQYHPDRNKSLNEAERKKLSAKFQQIQEAYETIKAQRENENAK